MKDKALAAACTLLLLAACGADKTPGVPDGSLDGVDAPEGWDMPGDFPYDGTDVGDCSEYVDSDGDTIADHHEGEADTDGDTIPNYLDEDSDNDGLSDAWEAGDSDLCTPPRHSDTDTVPDFLDPDSDNDGVSDSDETLHGTDPRDTDSDGDGVSDLVETEYGSDPLDPDDSPRSHGDFVFVVDYMEDPVPPEDTLVFGTDIQIADVYITIDTSGSMGGEVLNLQTSLETVIVPGIAAAIPNVQVGVGRFEDCPGEGCPNSIANLQNITDDMDLVQDALDTITDTSLCGGSEPYALALYITATADVSGTSLPGATCTAGYIGWPCFRPAAIPIVIQIGDEPFCEQVLPPPWPATGGCTCRPQKSVADAFTALNSIHAKYIGVNTSGVGGPLGPRPQMEQVAMATGSVASGLPLVFEGNEDGSGLGTEIVDAVTSLSSSVPLDISTQVHDVDDGPGDTVDAAIFVERVEPNAAGGVADPEDLSRVCVGGLATGDWDGDGHPDYFDDVAPGTIVCFDIIAARNETVPRLSDVPQLYTAEVRVMGDWITILDSREIYFLIPPDIHVEIPL
ncbi:MAG: hypothetical protein JRG91_07535 [Deltaproteobacteria bacterium]|nr:hypothetical protein [Deltaproteobacteria bacterium]